MTKAILRWVVPLVALLILGPVAGWLTTSLRAPDGGPETSLLLCNSPLRGLAAGLGCFAVAAAAGVIASRLLGVSWGMFAAGLVLAWAAWGTGKVDQILRRTQSASTFWTISVEGVIVGVLAVLAAFAVVRARPRGSLLADEADEDQPLSALAVGLPVMVLACAIGAWIVARETTKGQTFAAAAIGSMLAAVAGHLAAPRAPIPLFVAAIAILAAICPALSLFVNTVPTASGVDTALVFLPGKSQVLAAVRAGTMLPLARPLPLDWIAGAFVGIPIGLSWAGAMVEKHTPAEVQAR